MAENNRPLPCEQGEPFIKLATGQQAPVLNYELPQETSFTAYGRVSMNLADNYFTAEAKKLPEKTLQAIQNTPQTDISQGIIGGIGNIPLFPNLDFSGFDWSSLNLGNLDLGISAPYNLKSANINKSPQNDNISGEENRKQELIAQQVDGYQPEIMAQKLKDGFAISVVDSFGGFGKKIEYIERPFEIVANPANPQAPPTTRFVTKPQFYFIEEYVTISFIGDYGAGKTLQTHSLFPGEKNTITIKTFRETKSIKSASENIIDSFSKESAKELENLTENEASVQTQDSRDTNRAISANISFGFPKIGGSANASSNTSTRSSRNTNTRNLNKALSKSVDKSNSSRQITINTSTQDTSTESEEVTTVRSFENINKGRVLNFAFRELIQEYITITYLNDIKIGFGNGHPELDLVYSLEDLDVLLQTHIIEAKRAEIKERILFEYGKMADEAGNDTTTQKTFIESVNYQTFEESKAGKTGASTFLRKIRNVKSTYKHPKYPQRNGYTVEGIILNVEHFTLRTPAVVVDAFLGMVMRWIVMHKK